MIFRRSPHSIRRTIAALDPTMDAALIRTLETALHGHDPSEPTAVIVVSGQGDIHRIVTAHGDFELAQAGSRYRSGTSCHSTDRGTSYTR